MRFLIIAILSVSTAFGAFTEFYVQTTGSNMNAGSTATDTATVTYTGGDWDASTDVFTAAVGADMTEAQVGRWASVYYDGDTSPTANQYLVARITAVDSGARTVTLSTTARALLGTEVATSTSDDRSLKIGGAWAGPSGTSDFPLGFNTSALVNASGDPHKLWIKGGTAYSVSDNIAANDGGIFIEGYTSATGDGGYAEINGQASGTPFIVMTLTGTGTRWANIDFNGNHDASGAAASAAGNYVVSVTATGNHFYRCRFRNGYRAGLNAGGSGDTAANMYEECLVELNQFDDANDFGGANVGEESIFIRCRFTRNGAVRHANHSAAGGDSAGVKLENSAGEPVTFINCTFDRNAGDGIETTSGTPGAFHVTRSIFYDNGDSTESGDGIDTAGSTGTTAVMMLITDSIFVNNGLYDIRGDSSIYYPMARKCAFFGAGTASTLNLNSSFVTESVTITGDPFVDAAEGDFDLDNTANEGAALRGAGIGTLPANSSGDTGTTLGYPDVGPVQHQDAGGSPVTRAYIGN